MTTLKQMKTNYEMSPISFNNCSINKGNNSVNIIEINATFLKLSI